MATFKKAVKTESKLRLAVAGPAGSGKTYTALLLAQELAQGKPVAVIDTERGSASKYADLFAFDVLELDSFHPDRYVEAIQAAAGEGYGVVVIDSLSHAWNGTDGLLEQVEKIGRLRYNGNSFKAWGDVKPIENRLVEAITGSNIHVLATMRSKTEYVVEQNERGKATPRKIGTAPIQRDGFEYEFDVFGEMDADNNLLIHKTRCPALTNQVLPRPGKALAETLVAWLSGAPAQPAPTPTPVAPGTPAQAAPKPRSLSERFLALGYDNEKRDDLCKRITRNPVFDARKATGEEKQKIADYLFDLEEHQAGRAFPPEEPPALDLSELKIPATRP